MTGSTSLQPLVLVIDDELKPRRTLDSTLAVHGFRCFHAASRTATVLRAMHHAPNFVIVDATGARVDWLRMTGRLRNWTPAPILVLVGRATTTERRALPPAAASLRSGGRQKICKSVETRGPSTSRGGRSTSPPSSTGYLLSESGGYRLAGDGSKRSW
jgi:CheY-like chemotaxis protein